MVAMGSVRRGEIKRVNGNVQLVQPCVIKFIFGRG